MPAINKHGDEILKSSILAYFDKASQMYLPSLSIDTVIFSFHNNKLKVLLLRFTDTIYFMLPGGYLKKKENLDAAALRILQERTGLQNIYLEQFYTSGETNRSRETIVMQTFKKLGITFTKDSWLQQRFVSVCYYALVDETKVDPKPEILSAEFTWFDVKKLPALLFDHTIIINKALESLRADLDRKLVGLNLMNDTFTMNELQKLYEAVHGTKLVRTNFQRKMLSLGVLERLEKHYTGKAHKAPYLYKFIKKK